MTVKHYLVLSLKLKGVGDNRMEKEMATHSSILAWRIPGTGEPGGMPSMGSHRVVRLKQLKQLSSSSDSGMP